MTTQPTTWSRMARPLAGVVLALGVLGWAAPAHAQIDRADVAPPAMQGVGITEQLDTKLPLNLRFIDEEKASRPLGDFFKSGKPVILTLNYYGCTSLCNQQLNGLVMALQSIDWRAGKDFEIVTISFDPTEGPDLAKGKKAAYMMSLGHPGAEKGWHFLTGVKEPIAALTEAVGFRYKWDPVTKQYVHAAALILCTPDGKVARYLPGVYYDPKDLRLALLEAGEGKIGTLMDQFFMLCYHYDPAAGTYAPAAARIMKLGGAVTVVVLGIFLTSMWANDRRRRKARTPG